MYITENPSSTGNATNSMNFMALKRMQRVWIALFLIAVVALSFAPVAILGSAIGWPASLRNPAASQLAAIAAKADTVAFGYALYALYSLAIAPVAVIVAWRVTALHGPWSALIISFGALSAIARLIGILRWLTVMPVLATSYTNGDAASRTTTEMIFNSINAYGGGIGEMLGVALFGGLWLLVAMIAALRNRAIPMWLSVFGVVAALMQLALLSPLLGVASVVPIAAAVTVFIIWLTAFAVTLVRK